tara:strand:- start:287 stop:748 length:462 start_codon:yes stop_codon:yes gene_type:complete
MANRLLIGDRATGGYGLYVSKAGEDVLTCNKSDLYFWTEHEESGTAHVGYGQAHIIPYQGGSSSAPVNSASVNISSSSTASVSFQDIVIDGDDVMLMGGNAYPLTSSGIGSQKGIKFTSPSATGATANRSYSGTGGTFTVFIFKKLNDGVALI